ILADEAHDALLAVVAVDPLETRRREVGTVETRLAAIEGIEIANPTFQPRMKRPLEQAEIDLLLVAPLVPLTDLAAHEQQLLARMQRHIAEQRAQVRELLPFVARHLADQRAFAVNDLVVRERQHEVLRERVE